MPYFSVVILVTVKPFRGIRYNSEKIRRIEDVVAPPYDVISEHERQLLLLKSPFNFVRLSLGNQGLEKNSAEGGYEKAKMLIEEWVDKGILTREEKPVFYIYKEDYQVLGESVSMTGFFCLLRLECFSKGNVLPHEKTLPKPKEDRLLLLDETRCDLEPTWMLFEEQGNEVAQILEQAVKEKPLLDFQYNKERHGLWALGEEEKISALEGLFRERKMFIADGHHRYETALKFAKQDKGEAAQYKMVYCLNAKSSGLKILPTHRALLKVPEKETFIERLSLYFEVKEASKEKLMEALLAEEPCIGILFGEKSFLLKEKPAAKKLLGKKHPALRELPTVVLDTIVFQKALGTTLDNIAFVTDQEKLFSMVSSGEAEAGFLVQGTSVKQFEAVSLAKKAMPQKSTHFWPKPLSGLIFYKMD